MPDSANKTPAKERFAVRALLVTPAQHLLLIRLFVPDTQRFVWLTPGGGIEPNETSDAALRREVWEETGLQLAQNSGTHVWDRSATFTFRGERMRQHEQFYLVPVEHFEPRGDLNPAANEAELLSEFRWWSVPEILAADEYFAPSKLGNLLEDLQHNPPKSPISIGW